MQRISELTQQVTFWDDVQRQIDDLNELASCTEADDPFYAQLQQEALRLQAAIDEAADQASQPDSRRHGAILTVPAGAGGAEAQYWTHQIVGLKA